MQSLGISRYLSLVALSSVLVFGGANCDLFNRLGITPVDENTDGSGSNGDGVKSQKLGEKYRGQQKTNYDYTHINGSKTKVAFIIPAGAGAAYAPLKIAQALENKLNGKKIGNITDLAVGVSSGSIVAAGLTYGLGTPKNTVNDLINKVPGLMEAVFPEVNTVASFLNANDQGFKLWELQKMGTAINELDKNSIHLDSFKLLAQTLGFNLDSNNLILFFANVRIKELVSVAIQNGINAQKLHNATEELLNMTTKDSANNKRSSLRNQLTNVLGGASLQDQASGRFIAISSDDGSPVYFISQGIQANADTSSFSATSSAQGNTKVVDGLVASAAIPEIISGPDGIKSISGSSLSPLKDGVGAVGFDPSNNMYNQIKAMYPSDNIVMVYLGNGAKISESFRGSHDFDPNNVFYEEDNSRHVYYVALDTYLVDDKDNELFDICSVYYGNTTKAIMDSAVNKTISNPEFQIAADLINQAK